MPDILSPEQACDLAIGGYAVHESALTNKLGAATDAAGNSSDIFDIEAGEVLIGTTAFGARRNFGFMANSTSGNDCVVCIRGTSDTIDWIADANVGMDVGPGNHIAHKGFNTLAKSILTTIQPKIAAGRYSTVHVIGHSLGGAAATIVAGALPTHNNVKLYTFGAPRPGHRGLSDHMTTTVGDENMHRVYHDTDPVPMVPMFPFMHAPRRDTAYMLQGVGTIISADAHSLTEYRKTTLGGSWNALRASAMTQRRFNADTVDDVLKQAGQIPGGFLSSLLMRLIAKAISLIMPPSISLLQTGISVNLTVLDQMIMAIERGVRLVGAAADALQEIVYQIMRFLGLAAVRTAQITTQFLRWVMMKLHTVLSNIARGAIRLLG